MSSKKPGGIMSYIQKLRKLFLYAGVEREEYHRLLPMIREKNQELLRVSSLVAAVMFFLLYIASLLSNGFATVNSTTYMVCGVGMMIILLCSELVLSKKISIRFFMFKNGEKHKIKMTKNIK